MARQNEQLERPLWQGRMYGQQDCVARWNKWPEITYGKVKWMTRKTLWQGRMNVLKGSMARQNELLEGPFAKAQSTVGKTQWQDRINGQKERVARWNKKNGQEDPKARWNERLERMHGKVERQNDQQKRPYDKEEGTARKTSGKVEWIAGATLWNGRMNDKKKDSMARQMICWGRLNTKADSISGQSVWHAQTRLKTCNPTITKLVAHPFFISWISFKLLHEYFIHSDWQNQWICRSNYIVLETLLIKCNVYDEIKHVYNTNK